MAGTPRFVASITLLVLAATVSGGRADLSDVRINEFMASNSSVLADEDGDFSDWLELYNAGATTVDLDGAYLTDNANLPTKWRIPAVALDAGGFLVIFASSKDRASVG